MDIGKLIGVKYVVVGSISKIGETYSVDSRMIDVESEESFLTANYTTQESIDDIITTGAESIYQYPWHMKKWSSLNTHNSAFLSAGLIKRGQAPCKCQEK